MDNKWLYTISQSAHQEFPARMFVFPYAGANPIDFNIPALTSLKLDIHVLAYPGRGRRWKEDNYSDIETITSAIITELKTPFGIDGDKIPFIFMGYSMGALVAYEVARKLKCDHNIEPKLMVVIADEAPQTQKAFARTDVSDEVFSEELRTMDLIPKEILDDPEMLAMALPSLKADMMIENNYTFTEEKLSSPIVAVCGTDDDRVNESLMSSWGSLTTSYYEYASVPDAGHLFLSNSLHAAVLRSVIQRSATTLNIIKCPPKGDEETIQVNRIESSESVKLVGNCWVKWNKEGNIPKLKPSVFDSSRSHGLGAWYTDVKQQLQLRGIPVDPSWG